MLATHLGPDKTGVMSVVVVGSINQDLVMTVPRHPGPGETVLGSRHTTGPGGKGANQAVAASRLGADVALVGRVGDDAPGREMIAAMKEAGIDVSRVGVDPAARTGVAVVAVDEAGENSIVVSPGANARCAPSDVDAVAALLDRAEVTLLQLEIPLERLRGRLSLLLTGSS
jgi:ribokinase